VGLVAVWLFTTVGTVLPAQHTVRPLDATEGAGIYRSTCALCHGLEGRSVPGIDLASGQFRRASSDDDLVRIIREGIPDTAMPPHKLSEGEAANIVAYLHAMHASPEPASLSGEVARGKALFEGKGDCLTCHRVSGAGGSAGRGLRGPDLSGVGRIRKSSELARSIVEPDAEVLFSYRTFRGTTRDGATVSGRVLNEDTFTVQIVDGDGDLISLVKSDFRQYEFLNQSPMPSYRDRLTPQELADIVAYLASL
jgi:putative heme-binding domain-containing protein